MNSVIFGRPKPGPIKCRHPRKDRGWRPDATGEPQPICIRCGHQFDPTVQRKGRLSDRAGKDAERWVAKILEVRRVGQYGGPEDVGAAGDWIFAQSKSGPAWFSPRTAREIAALPVVAGKYRALVTVEKPGSGKPRRAMVTMDLEDFARLACSCGTCVVHPG